MSLFKEPALKVIQSIGISACLFTVPISANSLIAHWNFNEGAGTVLHDASGNGHNGVVSGASWARGVEGYSLDFDGVDDYVSIPDSKQLDSLHSLTVEAWIFANEVNEGHIVTKWGSLSNEDDAYALRLYAPDGYGLAVSGAGLNQDRPEIYGTIKAGRWVHLIAVFSGDSIKHYVNGILVSAKASMKCDIKRVASLPVLIGRDCTGTRTFNGRIDEISILDYPVTAMDVKTRFELFRQPPQVIAYYSFDENNGNVLRDRSGENADGTVFGEATWCKGIKNGALSFDGLNDYATVPHSAAFTQLSQMSVEAWVWFHTYGPDYSTVIVSKWGPGSHEDDCWHLASHNDPSMSWDKRPDFALSSGLGSRIDAVTERTIPLCTWVQLVGTWDGDTARIYMNGQLEKALPWSSTLNNNPSVPLCFGRSYPSFNDRFDGLMDEITISNYALSAKVISERYVSMISGSMGTSVRSKNMAADNSVKWHIARDHTILNIRRESGSLLVLNLKGHVVKNLSFTAADKNIRLSAGNLSAGRYIVKIKTATRDHALQHVVD